MLHLVSVVRRDAVSFEMVMRSQPNQSRIERVELIPLNIALIIISTSSKMKYLCTYIGIGIKKINCKLTPLNIEN